jgi:hypothetical protein
MVVLQQGNSGRTGWRVFSAGGDVANNHSREGHRKDANPPPAPPPLNMFQRSPPDQCCAPSAACQQGPNARHVQAIAFRGKGPTGQVTATMLAHGEVLANPVTVTANAARSLALFGTPASLAAVAAWTGGLLAMFIPLSVWRYRQIS